MRLDLDIGLNVNHQFRKAIGGKALPNGFIIDPRYGTDQAQCRYLTFPGGLEFYHFGATRFKEPIEMRTVNKLDSEWYFVHVNLSIIPQIKDINGEVIKFQKHLPIGILFCGQGLEMITLIPPNLPTEVASIRIQKSLLLEYLPDYVDTEVLKKSISYEDIDEDLYQIIVAAVNAIDDRLSCHSLVLRFLEKLFAKTQKHDKYNEEKSIHPEDLQEIMKVSSLLRNPRPQIEMSVEDLARNANMGSTKFKNLFKMVFGKPPKAYHNRIRMEYAQQNLQSKTKTASEISHELGYAHPSNFTTAYKKYFGKLPSEES